MRRALLVLTIGLFAGACAAPRASIPHLQTDGDATRLFVNGRPFLILGGEVGNSQASSAAALAPLWPTLTSTHLNTVLAPVYWELTEPREGRFDFASVDESIRQARAHRLRLVLLWFGTWKNSMSTYVPAWVKADPSRFPHARDASGKPAEILSALGEQTLAADSRAYAALMRHLCETDHARTVLMVQVENEVGFLPDAREHGPLADAAWTQAVPPALLDRLRGGDAIEPELRALWQAHGARMSGPWADVFGDDAAGQEVFTAWHYARYVDAVAARGRAEYPIPTFVNCALNRPGRTLGQYPSGGPLPHLLDVWRAGAPSVDVLAPDVYFFDFARWTARYARPGEALFVPETMRTSRAASNAFAAIAGQHAIGFSPFDIESIDAANARRLGDAYSAIAQLAPLLTRQTPTVAIEAVAPRVHIDGTVEATPQIVTVGPWRLTVEFDVPASAATTTQPPFGAPAPRGDRLPSAGGMILFTARDAYTIVGSGIKVTHAATDGVDQAGLLSVEEWRPDAAGTWTPFRRLNGDETNQGREVSLSNDRIGMQTVRLYRYR